MDELHEATMRYFYGSTNTVTMDVRRHAAWSSERLARQLSQAEREDLEAMLSIRGVKEVPEYADEPFSGPIGPRGGGGRKRHRGCQPDGGWKTRQKTDTGDAREEEDSPVETITTKVPSPRQWSPPQDQLDHLLRPLGTAIPAPPWYNHPQSNAISACSRTQLGATCGLHAVNHLLQASPDPVILTKSEFEQIGQVATTTGENNFEAGGSNYELRALTINLEQRGIACSPMTLDDITVRKLPFLNYRLPSGYLKPFGYLLRIPSYGGHWITLLRNNSEDMRPDDGPLLCDSLLPAPFVLTEAETRKLLLAFAIDACTTQNEYTPDYVCFLVGTEFSG